MEHESSAAATRLEGGALRVACADPPPPGQGRGSDAASCPTDRQCKQTGRQTGRAERRRLQRTPPHTHLPAVGDDDACLGFARLRTQRLHTLDHLHALHDTPKHDCRGSRKEQTWGRPQQAAQRLSNGVAGTQLHSLAAPTRSHPPTRTHRACCPARGRARCREKTVTGQVSSSSGSSSSSSGGGGGGHNSG